MNKLPLSPPNLYNTLLTNRLQQVKKQAGQIWDIKKSCNLASFPKKKKGRKKNVQAIY